MRFRIDLKIFGFLILFYFTKQIEIYSLMMLFCFLHELGHLISRHFSRHETYKTRNYATRAKHFF